MPEDLSSITRPRPAGGVPLAAAMPLRRAPSFLRRVLALVGALMLALVALGALGVWQAHESARRQVGEQIQGTARALARVVEFEFARAEALLQGLALSRSLREGDVASFLSEAGPLVGSVNLGRLSVIAPDGSVLGSTASPARPPNPALRAPPEVMEVFKTGRATASDYALGAFTGERRVLVAVPVRAAEGEGVQAILVASLPRERLRAALVDQRLPAGWVAAVLDRRHTVVARTRREEVVVGLPATAPVREGLARGEEGLIFDIVNQDGQRSVVGYARGPRFGYAVALAAPEAAFREARWAALRQLGALAAPVAATAVLLALLLGRHLSRALGSVATGKGRPQLREIEALAGALAEERAVRDAVEAALLERTAWLEAAQQAALVGVWQHDLRDGGSRWSAGMWRILGLPVPGGAAEAPLSAGTWLAHVHPEDRGRLRRAAAAQLAPDGPPFQEEFRVLTAGGEERWVQSQGVVERDAAGRPLRVLGAWIDVTARRAIEAEREALTRQRDLLADEIHHRVRNSLQLVLGLLVMQARRAAPEAAASLREAASRVSTIANVHRRLYEAGPDGVGDLGAYLGGLARDLHASVGGDGAAAGRPLRLELAPGVMVPPEHLPTIGIITAELMTNALKYGAGAVTLRLERRGGAIEVAVEDEGPGLPEGFDPATSARGLGMRVVTTLARQLRARIAVDREAAGGRVVLRLPEAAPPGGAA